MPHGVFRQALTHHSFSSLFAFFAFFVAIQLRNSGSKELFRLTAHEFANLLADVALFDQ